MSFIRKYRIALEMAGSPPQPSSAKIEVPLGVFTVAPVHQYGPSQSGASYCQTFKLLGTISWDSQAIKISGVAEKN